ncbi:MAG: PD40 domain-containing protein [Chloroflexi bacterium]|nr:PD40 domain-containing protein [Chloroflexota bacterium]MCI0784048.1 PD40 domain-containing protein [Chloroflexota bacterium]MCI0818192.1 PD40 domain-containing protein [Chloroflexota bacterium]MCI0819653.1 PD40 domain-containing protein [Chloroflexota bacterium]MCI0883957.1 PD40 domain-containing protein [Chloroflexota bacterium]
MTQSQESWPHRWVVIALGVMALGIMATLALVTTAGTIGGEPQPTPSPAPTASPSPTPTPAPATPTPLPDAPDTAYHLVFREFGATEDVIWRALPADPTQKVELARIPHREGFGITASLSPDGTKLAFLSLSATALSAQSSQAEAFVMDLETKEAEKIAENVDLAFAPLWSPDGKLLYMRRLAGPEFLSADVIIVRAAVPPVGATPPPPTPTLEPSQTPVPTRPALEEAFRDSISRVLSFIPVGFSQDEESLLFVQIRGGTQQGSLLGSARPATTEALEEAWNDYLELLPEGATPTPTGTPTPTPASKSPPDSTGGQTASPTASPTSSPTASPTPVPTPSGDTSLIVEMSDQITFDYDLSGGLDKLLFLAQEFTDAGVIANRAYWVDVPGRSVQAVGAEQLPAGYHLRPLWHADGQRVTLGVLPFDGALGQLIVVNRDGTEVENLALGTSGFDEPRSWAPDGSWLAVAHSEGDSLANRGSVSLALVARTGLRVTVIEGVDNATMDSVLGWLKVEEE